MNRRGRLLAVLVAVAVGSFGVISSTQTWLTVVLDDGSAQALSVAGDAALPVLAPLSLAVLALGGALAVVGPVLRYVFGALTVAIAATLAALTWPIVTGPGATHVASSVTEATGITGEAAVGQLIASITTTPWPAVTLAAWVLLLGSGVLTFVTAHRWAGGGRRFRTESATPNSVASPAGSSRPHDAIDDWDDLSRGDDPTR
ncbi:Trp biosynthesis-associated membrane protein [Microbacterium lacus]|uniref:Trp biosynthesis-associated membrane protein n=1 Tax=Microbacterium lacus TaxID=415217 RepID=UPI00384A80AB